MKVPKDFERMIAEGRIIEIADQAGRNAGRIDFLEGNPYGTEIANWRQGLKKIMATLDNLLAVNFWRVFETAYREGWGAPSETPPRVDQ